MLRSNTRLALIVVAVVAVFAVLRNSGTQTQAEGEPDAYPAPPTAGPTSPPVYVSETALAVAEARLDEWIANGEAPSDTIIESAIEITSVDAACFGMNGDLIAAGDPADVAAVYSGDSIDLAFRGRGPRDHVLVVIEKTFGSEYAVFSAPTLTHLLDQLTCAGLQ